MKALSNIKKENKYENLSSKIFALATVITISMSINPNVVSATEVDIYSNDIIRLIPDDEITDHMIEAGENYAKKWV